MITFHLTTSSERSLTLRHHFNIVRAMVAAEVSGVLSGVVCLFTYHYYYFTRTT